jgi:hypothetical protein
VCGFVLAVSLQQLFSTSQPIPKSLPSLVFHQDPIVYDIFGEAVGKGSAPHPHRSSYSSFYHATIQGGKAKPLNYQEIQLL